MLTIKSRVIYCLCVTTCFLLLIASLIIMAPSAFAQGSVSAQGSASIQRPDSAQGQEPAQSPEDVQNPEFAQNYGPKEQIISEAAILIDARTGQILYQKNMHKKMYPASITKVMTALIALEEGNLNSIITMSDTAVFSIGIGTSHIALDSGEKLALKHALYALAISSANDAANGIAEHVGGSLEGFASLMNNRAKKAGAYNTNFTNAHGLHDDEHYTTAYDMARITIAALKIPEFREIFTSERYEMPPTNKQSEARIFWRGNSMVTGKYEYEGVVAEKTGWTSVSQHTLVTAAEKDGRLLISVVMNSLHPRDKWADATALFDYGFHEFVFSESDYGSTAPGAITLNEEKPPSGRIIDNEPLPVELPARLLREDANAGRAAAAEIYNEEQLPAGQMGEMVEVGEVGDMSEAGAAVETVESETQLPVGTSAAATNAAATAATTDGIWGAVKSSYPLLFKILRTIGLFIGGLVALFILLSMVRFVAIQRRKRRRFRYSSRFNQYRSYR